MSHQNACDVRIDTSDIEEITDFIERNRERLAECPKFTNYLVELMGSKEAFIFLPDKGGLKMEPSMKMINAIAAMRRGGCR